jgi:hypothetical protein
VPWLGIVLAWDHEGAFKGGHLVRCDVVTDGAELVGARQLAAEPIRSVRSASQSWASG